MYPRSRMMILALIVLLTVCSTNLFARQDKTSTIPAEEATFTPEQLKEYYIVYKNPDVKYLRSIFNAYLSGSSHGSEDFEPLGKWSKDYYRSKFIVLSRDESVFNVTFITIMFQDHPDKIFIAAVYKRAKAEYLLRGLDVGKFSDEDIKKIQVRYRKFLQDKVHAM